MKKYLYLVLVALLILAGFFLYHRFKTRQITQLIGASQYRLEEYLHYPNPYVTLEEIDHAQASERVKKIIYSKSIHTNKPLLQYTLAGSVRKRIYWLADQGEGYYVIEAIDTSHQSILKPFVIRLFNTKTFRYIQSKPKTLLS